MNGDTMMNYNNASTDELHRIFQDHFKKWPRRFKWSVFICFFFPVFFYFSVINGDVSSSFYSPLFMFFLSINSVILFWGIKLYFFSKRYWHRNYHIYRTCAFSLIPLLTLIFQYSKYCL